MQPRTNGPCAIVHILETHSIAIRRGLMKAAAIVRNAENDLPRFPAKRDDNGVCPPVRNGIVNGFLGDPIKMHSRLMVRQENPPLAFEPTGYGEQRSDGNDQFVQRRHQARRAQVHGIESARDLARLNCGRP